MIQSKVIYNSVVDYRFTTTTNPKQMNTGWHSHSLMIKPYVAPTTRSNFRFVFLCATLAASMFLVVEPHFLHFGIAAYQQQRCSRWM